MAIGWVKLNSSVALAIAEKRGASALFDIKILAFDLP